MPGLDANTSDEYHREDTGAELQVNFHYNMALSGGQEFRALFRLKPL
jgi:hypothetical protein